MKFWAILGIVVLIYLGAKTIGGGSSASGPSAPTPTTAYKLAVIQTGSEVDNNDPLVGDFQTALDDLSKNCTEKESRLSDMAVTAHDDLKNNGIDESYLSILQHVNTSIPSFLAPTHCADIFAAYLVLRENG